jgi:hypothetical protein
MNRHHGASAGDNDRMLDGAAKLADIAMPRTLLKLDERFVG